MKKSHLVSYLFFTLFTMLLVSQAHAQFGIRAGLNFSNFNDSGPGNLESSTGFQVGGYYTIKVPATPLSIQPEVLYTQKGAEQSGTEINVDYIEVPLLAKFSLVPGPVSPNIYAGPYVGFVLNSEVTNGGSSLSLDNAQTDIGGIIGGGVDINAGVTKVNLGLRYGLGFSDAFEGGQGKNGVFSIIAGISF